MPSVTMAIAPLFLAMPASKSPSMPELSKPSEAAISTSPGSTIDSAAIRARLSFGPHQQVIAGPAKRAMAGTSGAIGLIAAASAPRPFCASISQPVGASANLASRSLAGRSMVRRMVRRGGSVSMSATSRSVFGRVQSRGGKYMSRAVNPPP